MSYMWDEFNIKTFAAETIVYRDGVYCADLSTLPCAPIGTRYDLPVHIIYIGEIAGKNELNIEINAENQPVFLDVNVKNKKPAFLNIFIKNTGKKSEIRGHVLLENHDTLTFDCRGVHGGSNTGILVQTNIIAGGKSKSKLSGAAIIERDAADCISDITFCAMCDAGARVEFMPAQHISAVPLSAGHSASLYSPDAPQIQYLHESGMSRQETIEALREAFRNKFTLF